VGIQLPRSLLILALASACSRTSKSFPIGGDLHSLPSAGSAPLMALVPAQAEAVIAFRDPAASLEALRATGFWTRFSSEGWLRDSLALPPVERWRAIQAKLSELARIPLPGPEALLHSQALLAWAPQTADRAGGLLYVARTDPSVERVWSLARALNAVRPSGREVELERIRGIPVREVSFGTGTWVPAGQRLIYAVLADRLLVSTDENLMSEALALALDGQGHSLANRSPFGDLESRAQSVGFAGAWLPSGDERLVPGLRSAELDGRDLTLQLDPTLWSESSARPVADPSAIFLLGFSGLDPRATLAKFRPQLESAATAPVLQRLDALVGALGPGLFAEVVPDSRQERGIAVAVDVLRAQSAQSLAEADEPVAALAAVFLNHPQPAEPIPGGILHCSAIGSASGSAIGSEGDEVCLATCERVVRLAWPGGALRERGCPGVKIAAPSDVLLAVGSQPPLLSAELREGRGQLLFPEPK